jgi:hypothetical protein
MVRRQKDFAAERLVGACDGFARPLWLGYFAQPLKRK